MAASTEPRSGLKYGWALGESGWNTDMDANLLQIGRVGLHLSVLDRTLTAPPATPADGDTYIPAATASGAWAGHENDIAIWDATAGAWVFYTPRTGWIAYMEAEGKLAAYTGTAWSAGVAL